jgi:hypothetical protein
LPTDDALVIGRQIVGSMPRMSAASCTAISNRPWKVKADGTVKVLDFGLAKALDPLTP